MTATVIGIALQVWIVTPVVWFTQEHNRFRREEKR